MEKRLVLGFDAGCTACSGLAARIEEQVGDRLEVRSLSDPQMEHWRKQALGEDARWVPTLVEIEGGQVRAWTGLRMGAALGRRLGPGDTWRVMQAIGEAGSAPEIRTAPVSASGPTRRQFIKGLAGGLLALSVLPVGQALAATRGAPDDYSVRSVSADSATVTRLKRFRSVKAATGKFGTLDWNGVERSKYRDKEGKERAFFAIPYRSARTDTEDAGAVFLVAEDEATVEDAYSLVIRVRQADGRRAAFDYYLPNGTPLATIATRNGRVAVRAAGQAPREAERQGVQEFAGCFIACLGSDVSVTCALNCAGCITPPAGVIECSRCIICAGRSGFRCARLCRPLL